MYMKFSANVSVENRKATITFGAEKEEGEPDFFEGAIDAISDAIAKSKEKKLITEMADEDDEDDEIIESVENDD
jgi:hypothetical protein